MATQIKCSLVGDGAVGKMCLASGDIPEIYTPVVFETIQRQVTLDPHEVTLTLSVTAGLEGYERTRHASYPGTDVFMACFSLMRRDSTTNIGSKWIPEIRSFSETVPILLVGTQMDLRTNEEEKQRLWDRKQEKPISTKEGKKLALTVGAKGYMECSAKTGENLKSTMEQAVRLALEARGEGDPKHKGCILQ